MKKIIEKGIEIYKKYREGINYLIAGGIATVLNIAVFAVLTYGCKIDYEISNIIAIIVAILFQYVSNKFFVFESKGNTFKENVKEFVSFISCRLVTMVMDQGMMKIGVDIFNINELLMKIIVNIIVIIVNYIFSKLIIFKKKKEVTN